MTDGARRRPGTVPDDHAEIGVAADTGGAFRWGADTDGDGQPDTLLTPDGPDLLVLTDLDGDGLADRVLRIGPDGAVHPDPMADLTVHPDRTDPDPAPLVQPVALRAPDCGGPVHGGAPAHEQWSVLLGRLFGMEQP